MTGTALPPFPFPLPTEFSEPLSRALHRLGPFACRIMWYPEVTSTNDVAAMLAERGVEEGCVILANAQTAGRGRHGRTWTSPPGAGLYLSTVVRPRQHAVPLLTLAAGLAVAEGVYAATGLEPRLKWPNDVYLGDCKVAGILAEAGSSDGGVPHVILGVGINVQATAYPRDIAASATCLETELGRPTDRGLLMTECLAALALRYADLQDGRSGSVVQGWRQRAAVFGRTVEWDAGGQCQRGIAENLDETGALLVRTDHGVDRVISGEVRWI